MRHRDHPPRRHPRPGHPHPRHGQRGASLIIVLALVAFLGILLPAVLGLAFTGTQVTRVGAEDRRATYAGTSAIEAAVALAQDDLDVGDPRGVCPDLTVPVDQLEVTVECLRHPPPAPDCFYVDRFVSYLAQVREPGDPAVLATVSAEVAYRFDPPTVEVRQWNPDASGPPSTAPLPPCDGAASPSSTTTTTQPPVAAMFSEWDATAASPQVSGGEWWAEGRVTVTDALGEPIADARVTADVEYRFTDDPPDEWRLAETLTSTTTDSGSITFHSGEYPTGGNPRVREVRFTITSVDTDDPVGWVAEAHPVTLQIAR